MTLFLASYLGIMKGGGGNGNGGLWNLPGPPRLPNLGLNGRLPAEEPPLNGNL